MQILKSKNMNEESELLAHKIISEDKLGVFGNEEKKFINLKRN